jgi:hypothetical protein
MSRQQTGRDRICVAPWTLTVQPGLRHRAKIIKLAAVSSSPLDREPTPEDSPSSPPSSSSGAPSAPPGWTQPPRRSDRVVWIIASVVVVLLVACLGLGTVGYVATRHTKDPAATGNHVPPSSAEPGAHADTLAQYLVPIPPGAPTWPNQPAEEGLPDLEPLRLELDSPAVDVGFLQEDNFRRGYERRWIDGKGTTIEAHLFQFQGADGAAHYARMTEEAAEVVFGWGEPRPVPGAVGAVVQIRTFADKSVRAIGVVLSGNLVAIIDTKARSPYDPKPLNALLTQQAQLLH